MTAVKLQQEVVDPEDVSMLEDLILAAYQDAFAKVGEAQGKMMSAMTGGMRPATWAGLLAPVAPLWRDRVETCRPLPHRLPP